jgi:hypothetical protein
LRFLNLIFPSALRRFPTLALSLILLDGLATFLYLYLAYFHRDKAPSFQVSTSVVFLLHVAVSFFSKEIRTSIQSFEFSRSEIYQIIGFGGMTLLIVASNTVPTGNWRIDLYICALASLWSTQLLYVFRYVVSKITK